MDDAASALPSKESGIRQLRSRIKEQRDVAEGGRLATGGSTVHRETLHNDCPMCNEFQTIN